MSKKYLSLEETAAVLRMGTDEVIRLREKGGIRGFADRGTWKFREEDVQQVLRSRQADSDPDVPLLRDLHTDGDSAIGIGDEIGEQPTIIRKGGDSLSGSDSEVKLVGPLAEEASHDALPAAASDSGRQAGGDSGLLVFEPDDGIPLAASDSKLMSAGLDSDSEVRLVSKAGNSDSDVALISESSAELQIGPLDDALGSDSDVRLIADEPQQRASDSDVKLVQPGQRGALDSDSDVALLRDDDESIALDFTPDDTEGASVLAEESGLALVGDDSAMLLRSESGISLEGPSDSGIALNNADDDEGITLEIGGDSGISLEAAGDSGISLESVADSGISLEDSSDFGGTVPMMKVAGGDDEDETAFEIPALKSDDSEFELGATGGSDSETAVFDLADSEESLDDAVFDVDEGSDEFGETVASEDDLDVAEDVLGEDDELDDLDVFDADEDVFDEGASPAGQKFAAPTAAVVVEQEWGAGTLFGLLFSTAMLAVVGIVMFDLVNNIWTYKQPTSASSALLESLGGLYGK